MPIFELTRKIKAHPSSVWKVISNYDNYVGTDPDIIRFEKISEDVHRLYHKHGKTWDEKCTDRRDNKSYSLEVIGGNHPLPVTKINRICSMREESPDVLLRLKYQYTPKYAIFGGIVDKFYIASALKTHSNRLLDNLATKIYQTKLDYHCTAATIINQKSTGLITITQEMTVTDANTFRAENKIGFLLVLDKDKNFVGVLSERDIVNGLSKHGYTVMEQPVSEIMTRDIISCGLEDELQTLMSLMTEHRIRHLPIVDGKDLRGVISIGDVVKARMNELEKESEAMHNYIKERRWREVSLQIGRSGATEEYADPGDQP